MSSQLTPAQLTPAAALSETAMTAPPGPPPPEAVVQLHESHHRNLARAFLAQRTRSSLIAVGVKLVARIGALVALPFVDVGRPTTSLVTAAIFLWIGWDLMRAPMTRAAHRAGLPFALNGKVVAFLAQRAKAHKQAGLPASALEDALVADLGGNGGTR